MKPDRLSTAVIPLLAAFVSGVIGAGFGGYLTSKQWRYERTLDAYTELIGLVDRALIIVSDLPVNAKISTELAERGMTQDALRYVERNHPNNFYDLLVRTRSSAHSV